MSIASYTVTTDIVEIDGAWYPSSESLRQEILNYLLWNKKFNLTGNSRTGRYCSFYH